MDQHMVYPIVRDIFLCEAITQGKVGSFVKPVIDVGIACCYGMAHDYYEGDGPVMLDIDVPVRHHRVVLANEIFLEVSNLGAVGFKAFVDCVGTGSYSDDTLVILDKARCNMDDRFAGILGMLPDFDVELDVVVCNYTARWN